MRYAAYTGAVSSYTGTEGRIELNHVIARAASARSVVRLPCARL